ncbi:MAG: glycosyltransferase family 2 protein [Phycisphaeraceae bacterium]
MNVDESSDDHVRPVVVMPTYNNAGTLREMLERVEALALPMVVVNDGSTDATADRLAEWQSGPRRVAVDVVAHAQNQGKAAALRSGFARAEELGYTHAVTIDTDLQHSPEEIPLLLNAARAQPGALVLGARRGDREHQPARRRVARGLANRLVRWACGRTVADTQSGFRVYPLELVRALRCRSGHYAYETEMVVRAIRAGRGVVEVAISGRYLPPGTGVSHFRAGRDSLRWAGLMGRLLAERVWPGGKR